MTELKTALLLAALVGVTTLPSYAGDSAFRDCPDCPLMQPVPPGAFEMGYEADDANPETDAQPVHRVVIDKGFAIGVYEITRAQFAAFIEDGGIPPADECNVYDTEWWYVKKGINWQDPGFDQGDDEPVVCVSWHDAQRYVAWLHEKSGKPYRLPSEAEWEYVATNAGTLGPLDGVSYDTANLGAVECCGPRQHGNDRFDQTAPVGSFVADGLGLHDVRGNVWEWMEDCYHEHYERSPADGAARTGDCSHAGDRVVRGGSYGDDIFYLRAGYRLRAPAENGYFTLGFRVALTLD